MRPLLLSAAAFLIATFSSAQTADITVAGAGCMLEGKAPAMGYKGLPQLGATFSLNYTGPNHQVNHTQSSVQPILNIGFTAVGLPIPAFLPAQPIGCVMYVAPTISIPMAKEPNGRPSYVSSQAVPVPNNTALLGGQFFAQWLAVKNQCGIAGCGLHAIATSDFATITIGK